MKLTLSTSQGLKPIANRPISGPIVIGATGGSGTRVVARIVREGGLFIGDNLNVSEDALVFGDFSDRWINPYLKYSQPILKLFVHSVMWLELRRVLARHLAALPASRQWGWKEPRSIYLLRFFHKRFPNLKFIHVVRDGRDMAFSSNQNQLNRHGDQMLGKDWRQRSLAERSIALWTAVNMQAAHYGETLLRERYLRVCFEDLCASAEETISRIFMFAEVTGDVADLAGRHVLPPPSLGRWQTQDGAVLEELQAIGRAGLERFGYLKG